MERACLCIAVAIALACSPSTGMRSDAGTDAEVPDAPRDLEPPTVVSVEPADGADPVSVLTVFRVAFSEPLDVGTVTEENVVLRDSFGTQLAGSVSYDTSDNMIVFDPDRALVTARDHELTIGDVTDAAGNPLSATASISVRTYANRIMGFTSYGDAGEITSWGEAIFDETGQWTRVLNYDGAGSDGAWHTGDDQAAAYTAYERTPQSVREVRYGEPGPDGVFLTDDDVVTQIVVEVQDERGLVIREEWLLSGPDGLFDTTDDVLGLYYAFTYDAGGRVTLELQYDDAGADGTWLTSDDFLAYNRSHLETTYDSLGRVVRTEFRGAGDDRVFPSGDDTFSTYSETIYDDAEDTARTNYHLPGPDDVFGTADDMSDSREDLVFDAHGRIVSEMDYNGAGTDGEWLTGDDIVVVRRTNVYGLNDTVAAAFDFDAPGPDAVWGTSDDRQQRAREYEQHR